MNDVYYFHQTPEKLAKELIKYVPIEENDVLYEPFKGEGAFYNNFPTGNKKIWSEIQEGVDFRTINEPYDWVITNPPFRLENNDGKEKNAVWQLFEYFADRANKGIAFLINSNCCLTPRRYDILFKKGFSLVRMVVCNVKKWRGRYYFMVFKKNEKPIVDYLIENY